MNRRLALSVLNQRVDSSFWRFLVVSGLIMVMTVLYFTYSNNTNSSQVTFEEIKAKYPFKPQKILVTGGGGFIGSHTALKLLERGDEVVIVDEMNTYYDLSIKEENVRLIKSKYGEDRVRFHTHDITDISWMRDLWKKEKFDKVCHMAARAGVRPSIEDPLIYVHSNVRGTTVLLELAKEFSVKNFVFASSSSVYGGNTKVPFEETDSVENPVSPYAATKRMCELMAYTYHTLYKFPIAALRFFTVYGPRGRPDMAPYIFISKIINGSSIDQFGDGTSYRDYTYIDDIVSGIIGALDYPQGYQIYNLGRGEPLVLKDFVHLIEKVVGKKANVNIKPKQMGDVPATYASTRKAKRMIGFEPKFSTEEGIRRTVEWFQNRHKEL